MKYTRFYIIALLLIIGLCIIHRPNEPNEPNEPIYIEGLSKHTKATLKKTAIIGAGMYVVSKLKQRAKDKSSKEDSDKLGIKAYLEKHREEEDDTYKGFNFSNTYNKICKKKYSLLK